MLGQITFGVEIKGLEGVMEVIEMRMMNFGRRMIRLEGSNGELDNVR
jgi:hypothetical protein